MNKKKLFCCGSMVRDLLLALALDNPEKAEKMVQSEEAKEFVEAAEAFAAKMEE